MKRQFCSVRRLKYMDMVVRETLRLCAPVQAARVCGVPIQGPKSKRT